MRSFSFRSRTTGLALLVVLVLSLALTGMVRLAAHATAATPTITLSRVTGPPTSKVTISGTAFGSSETVIATFDTSTTLGTTTTSSTGSFSLGITIPTAALPGKHSIQVMGQSSKLTASRSFLVNTNWNQFGYDKIHSRTNPYENVLSPSNVSQLTLDWSYTSGKGFQMDSSPAVVNGVVYFGSTDGNVYAFHLPGMHP
jgi:outer membrane protein assembly factor BamB